MAVVEWWVRSSWCGFCLLGFQLACIEVACLGIACPNARAQSQLAEMRGHRLDPRDLDTGAVAFVDVDRDGDLDLVVGNGAWAGYQISNLYLNDGSGVFTHAPQAIPENPQPTTCIGTGDLDGDGDPDLVLGNFGYGLVGVRNQVLINDGRGRFADETAVRMPAYLSACATMQFSDATRGVAVTDVDRDGDLDLVFANWCQNRLYLNDGRGHFSDASFDQLPRDFDNTNAVVAGDLDRDGDVDLVFGNAASGSTAGQDRVYWNDGSGCFLDATPFAMPFEDRETFAMALGDVDRDGDLDLVTGNSPLGIGHGGRQSQLFLNDGRGRLRDATDTHFPRVVGYAHALALADFDGDHALDLVIGNGGSGSPGPIWFWRNDGRGVFTEVTEWLPLVAQETYALASGDVDRDGDPDLAVGNFGIDRLLFNRHRHLTALEEPKVAARFTLEFSAAPGYARQAQIVIAYLAAGRRWFDLGPFGFLGLDPSYVIELRPTLIGAEVGIGRQTIAVPPRPELAGLEFFVQGLVVPDHARFTNVWGDRVRP